MLKNFWQSSQLRAALLIKAAIGGAVVLASAVLDPSILPLLKTELPASSVGYVLLAAAAIVYLASPHPPTT